MSHDDQTTKRGFLIDFIDPLFAVAIHVGFVDGLMREHWLEHRSIPHSLGDWANALMFGAGLWVLGASWIGYHQSIQRKPLIGIYRFALDIVLLVSYIFMLVYFNSVPAMATLLAAIYLIYIFWDYFKTVEYPGEFYGENAAPSFSQYLCVCFRGFVCTSVPASLSGEIVTVGWATFFILLSPLSYLELWSSPSLKISFAVFVVVTNFLYRRDKKYKGAIVRFIPFKILLLVLAGVDCLLAAQFLLNV
jgi:hypothetical protein